ncbi:MAG: hypothetical protein A2Y04_05940 [Omnitrophica WOR_2 bacterium GWC2_45_7]|nr:MAG: hypothetical protein A2Y04_05940 [Omnitrophica WOR_2 bacterium GWC2_45_7]
MLVQRDIRVRYKQAAMGVLWAVFMPIVAVAAGILIKKAMSVVSGKPMDLQGVVSISVKVLPWTFFVSALKFSVNSLVGNSSLITKIYFPREVLPLASIVACLFDFAIAMVVLTILLIFAKVGVSIYLFWLPVILLSLFLFTAGLGFLLSAANLFYRDVRYIVEVILMFGIFFTPVLFQADMFGDWQTILLLNPVGSILEAINDVVVRQRMPDPLWLSYAMICSVLMFFTGIHVFHKKEPLFAENV